MRTDKMKRIAALVLAMLMAAFCLTACGGDAKTVNVSIADDNVKTDVEAKVGDKIADILKAAGLTLGAEDVCEPAADSVLEEGVTAITIKRGAKDAEPATEAVTTETVEYKEVKEIEKIPYETKEAYSDEMEEGTSEVTQKGAEGEKEVTYKVKLVDGKEVSREKVSEKITKEPVDEIVTYGTASYDDSDDDGGVYEVSRTDYPDCDGSGHGYWEVHYSDGSVDYIEY